MKATTFPLALLSAWLALAPLIHGQTADQIQRAVKQYPELMKAGSPLNLRFLKFVDQVKSKGPSYVADPEWMLKLAKLADQDLKDEEEKRLKKLRVFDTLIFGDSEFDVRTKLDLSEQVTRLYPDQHDAPVNIAYGWRVGDVRMNMSFKFAETGLAKLALWADPVRASHLDTHVRETAKLLVRVASARYGEPSSLNPFPTVLNLAPGQGAIVASWKLPDRTVEVSVVCEGFEYYAELEIIDPERMKQVGDAQKEATSAAVKKASKAL